MTIPKTFDESFAHVSELASRFNENESAYLSQKYMEQEVRDQLLNPFFEALGWDIYHKEHPNPYEREVKIEKSVMVGDHGKRAVQFAGSTSTIRAMWRCTTGLWRLSRR